MKKNIDARYLFRSFNFIRNSLENARSFMITNANKNNFSWYVMFCLYFLVHDPQFDKKVLHNNVTFN